MIVALVIGAVFAAVIAGVVVGRWLILRELAEVVDTAAANAKRSNIALVKVERIAADWPGVVERVEKLHPEVVRFIVRAQVAEELAADTAARQAELEQAVAANFGIALSKGA